MKNGPYGWQEKIFILQKRTEWLCKQLKQLKINYYRNPFSNIIAIRRSHVSIDVANKYGLVPDNHLEPKWFKVDIMEHVSIGKLSLLVEEIKKTAQHKL